MAKKARDVRFKAEGRTVTFTAYDGRKAKKKSESSSSPKKRRSRRRAGAEQPTLFGLP